MRSERQAPCPPFVLAELTALLYRWCEATDTADRLIVAAPHPSSPIELWTVYARSCERRRAAEIEASLRLVEVRRFMRRNAILIESARLAASDNDARDAAIEQRGAIECPRCEANIEYTPRHDAEPDTGTRHWNGGYRCMCGWRQEDAQ